MKNKLDLWVHSYPILKKIIMEFKIALLLIVACASTVFAAPGYSQVTKVSLDMKDKNLEQVMDEIERQSEFYFIFNQKQIDVNRVVDIQVENKLISDILPELFAGTNINYSILDRKILLTTDNIDNNLSANSSENRQQQVIISGKITDTNGGILPGVNVVLKGTMMGAISNTEGIYTISVPDGNGILVFSFIGYISKELSISGNTKIDVMLSEEMTSLNEVVVTALGIKREKKALTYAVSEVKGESLTKVKTINLGNSLAGRVAGVTSTGTAGGPGSSSRIIIRGNGSLSGDNQPLIVVNGIPISNYNEPHTNALVSTLDRGNGLSSLNPDDIESISVLKGGASAALYGSRAANGVILVTTKSGVARKGIGVEFNSTFTLESPNLIPDWQYEYGSGTQGVAPVTKAEAIANGRVSWGARMDGSSVIQFDGVSRPYTAQKNNYENFYDYGKTFTNSLAFIGGNENVNFRFSAANTDISGIVPNNTLNNKSFNLAASANLSKKIVFEGSAQYTIEKGTNRVATNNVSNNPNSSIDMIATNVDVRNLAPGYGPLGLETEWNDYIYTTNPYFAINKLQNKDERRKFVGSFSARYNMTDYLYLRARMGIDQSTFIANEIVPNGILYNPKGAMSNDQNVTYETNSEIILGFDKRFGSLTVNAIVGGNLMYNNYTGITLTSGLFNVPGNYFITNGVSPTFNQIYAETATNSVFGSADVGYNDYLYLTITGRQDWFSTLPIESNSVFYPSVGLSFLASNAWKSKPSWMTYSKIRGSWAQVGGGAPSAYGMDLNYLAGSSTHLGQSYMSIPGTIIPTPISPYTSTTTELGIDLRMFENRLGFDITLYNRVSNNDIVPASVAPSTSYSSVRLNVGKMVNRGVEFMVNGTPIQTSSGFSWDLSLNVAYNDNEVIKIADGLTQISNGGSTRSGNGYVYSFEGQPFGMVSGFKYKQDADGNTVYNNVTGFPIKSVFGPIGRGVPPLTIGFNNNFTYKNFSLGFLLDGRFGSVMYSATNDYAFFYGKEKRTVENNVRETGILVEGVDQNGAPYSKTFTAQAWWQGICLNYTDPFVSKNGFIKVRQFTFGYNISKAVLSKTPFEAINVSLVGRDLFLLWSQMPNLDPERANNNGNGQGVEGQGMPSTRSVGVNLQIKF
jgi:TonB-linked SusC/RagA family outer membrane protein